MKSSDLHKQRWCCLLGEVIEGGPSGCWNDIKNLREELGRRWWQLGWCRGKLMNVKGVHEFFIGRDSISC